MEQLRIGLVGTSQLSFPGDKETAYGKCISGMKELSAAYGFALSVWQKTVITPEDAGKAIRFFEEEGVDFVLIQHTSYSSGFLAEAFADYAVRKQVYLGLWAIPEGVVKPEKLRPGIKKRVQIND